jgi:hypothetical protein
LDDRPRRTAPQVCEVNLQANDADKLIENQTHFAAKCQVRARGLARVGIIALVDEATGLSDVTALRA